MRKSVLDPLSSFWRTVTYRNSYNDVQNYYLKRLFEVCFLKVRNS